MMPSDPDESTAADDRPAPPSPPDDVAATLQAFAAGSPTLAPPVNLFDATLGGVYFPGEGDAASPPRQTAIAQKRAASPRDPSTPST